MVMATDVATTYRDTISTINAALLSSQCEVCYCTGIDKVWSVVTWPSTQPDWLTRKQISLQPMLKL